MSKAQHTPGPWKTNGTLTDGTIVIEDANKNTVCHVFEDDAQANARLIASAPDLLKERDELKEQLKAAKVAFDKEVTQYDKEWSSHKATQSINAELLECLKEAVNHKHVYDTNPALVELFSAFIAKAEGKEVSHG